MFALLSALLNSVRRNGNNAVWFISRSNLNTF